jgi:hypothetical protein
VGISLTPLSLTLEYKGRTISERGECNILYILLFLFLQSSFLNRNILFSFNCGFKRRIFIVFGGSNNFCEVRCDDVFLSFLLNLESTFKTSFPYIPFINSKSCTDGKGIRVIMSFC